MVSMQWLSDRLQERAYFAVGTVSYAFIAWILMATLDLNEMPRGEGATSLPT
jgi:hypothetical protein